MKTAHGRIKPACISGVDELLIGVSRLFSKTIFLVLISVSLPCIAYAEDAQKITDQLNWELMQACKKLDSEKAVADLLDAGADAKFKDGHGHTPLHFLAGFFLSPKEGESFGDYIEAAKFLTEAGAEIDAVDEDGVTPLVMATRIDHFEMAYFLIDAGADPTIIPADGRPVLHYAAQATETDLCHKLIAAGADPCRVDEEGVTPLMMIASEWKFTTDKQVCETLELLMKYDQESLLDANKLEKLLNRAAEFGAVEFAKILIAHGARVDVPSSRGVLPMHRAAARKQTEILPLLTNEKAQPDIWVAYYLDDTELFNKLIAHGADVDKSFYTGRTLLYEAATMGKLNWVNIFLEQGAVVNTVTERGTTPLSTSVSFDNDEVVKLLLAKGADPTIASDDAWTPLHSAAIRNSDQIVQMLLNAGANPNVFDDKGDTPLHWAAKHHCDASVKQLILGGADLNVRNNDGETPFSLACLYSNSSTGLNTAKLLLRWSANPCILDNNGRLPWHVFRLLKQEDYQYFGENEKEIRRVIAIYNERLQPIIDIVGCCE